jgi:hypothetical protein
VRIQRWSTVAGFAVIGGILGACSLVTGLGDYTQGDDVDSGGSPSPGPPDQMSVPIPDSGKSVGKPVQPDAPLNTDEEIDGTIGEPDGGDEAAAAEGGDAGPEVDSEAEQHEASVPGDAGDDGSAHGDEDGGAEAGCAHVTHMNGLGQNFVDCLPLKTYNITQAQKACAAYDAGPCGTKTVSCVAGGTQTLECETTAGACACWAYSGTYAGLVNRDALGNTCECPGAALSNPWN